MTKYGNQVVEFGTKAGPYVGAIAIMVGVTYAFMAVANLVFNTKMDLGRMAIDYVRDNMNVFGESEPVQAMMERMMPNGVDILSAIDNFKQKYE